MAEEIKHYVMHARHVVDESYYVWCHSYFMGPFSSQEDAYRVMMANIDQISEQKVKKMYGPVKPVIMKVCTDNNGEMESLAIGMPYESDVYQDTEVCLVK